MQLCYGIFKLLEGVQFQDIVDIDRGSILLASHDGFECISVSVSVAWSMGWEVQHTMIYTIVCTASDFRLYMPCSVLYLLV